MNTGKIRPGLYVLKVQDLKGNVTSVKLVKK